MPSKMAALLAERELARRAVPPVGTFLALVVAGVGGFVTLGGVGVVEAAFWLLDPASIELYYHEHGGSGRLVKLYSIVVTTGLVVASLWLGETVLSAAFGGRISAQFARAKQERALMDTTDHVVICGYGMFGRTVARDAEADGREVVVVERDGEQAERAMEDGHLVVEGDARRESVLEEAGIGEARSLVAAIDDSNANVQIAIAASQLSPDLRIVTRVGEEMYESLARRAGADEVVIPEVVSGRSIARDLL